eukprot:s22_g7.t1
MDLQNVIYRYFADSARFFKKIQHSIRSGEAELMVICDGEEPRAEDLEEAFKEFLDEVEAFRSWTHAGRTEAGLRLKETSDKEASYDSTVNMMVGGAVGAVGGSATNAAGAAVALGGGAAGVAGAAGFGAAVGVGAAVGIAKLYNQLGSCFGPRKKTPFDDVMSSWDDTAQAEKELVAFLPSLTWEFHNSSYKKALEKTQELRSELDRFLQLLQKEGLIFDPCGMSSRFQCAPGHAGQNL